ncbi:uncharacterized protein A1O5_10916 [Cladophialophora psammophila CBS 110553]|uniref:Uncharacterized protein n=1 Tax=Cladophialophora psammophila CBS 110553 TaxID=1182543 RepID=W9WLS3_9EURO|nr:uncharacterized protein A1O5_10916 [Cladophialophora psammophila CBS 110553]EXJ65940.1 hypothetical protein A1O5_10916 [Cladophialophora psammophila CBS 110553]
MAIPCGLANSNSHNELFRWPTADPLGEKYCYTTVEHLSRALELPDDSTPRDREIQTSYQNNILTVHSKLAMIFASSLSTLDPGAITAINKLLTQAVEFVLVSVERCRVRLFLPSLLGKHMPLGPGAIKDMNPSSEG